MNKIECKISSNEIANKFNIFMPKYFKYGNDIEIAILETTSGKYITSLTSKDDTIPDAVTLICVETDFDFPGDALAFAYKQLMCNMD